MTQEKPQGDQQNAQQNAEQNAEQNARQDTQDTAGRSESLLPGAESSEADDGRFEIAEEVNLDQQSDALHHVGNLPEDGDADALAGTLKKD